MSQVGWIMAKRILLFLLTNLVVVVTVSLVLSLLGLDQVGGFGGLVAFCLVWGMAGSFVSLAMSRWMAKWALGVRLIDGHTGDPTLDWVHATVARLADRAGLPMPEVGFYDSPEVNAFATGPTRSRSLVAVSAGLLRAMDRREVEGVLAHELAHVANGDMVTMALIQGVVNAFVMLVARLVAGVASGAVKNERASDLVYFLTRIVAEIVLGFGGMMITAAFSRRREFRADQGGADLAGRDKMIAALARLRATHELVDDRSAPALASFKIAGTSKFLALLSTHPPLDERIEALRAGPAPT